MLHNYITMHGAKNIKSEYSVDCTAHWNTVLCV